MKLVVSWTQTRIAWCLGALMLIWLNIGLFTPALSQEKAPATSSPVELTQGWQYRWGNSPLDDAGIPVWTKETISSPGWESFRFPKKLNRPPRAKILWLRVPLPKGQWKSPSVYLRSIPYILDAYLQNQRIYSQYSLTASGQSQFANYQWPIVSLEPGFQDKPLLFKVDAGKSSSIYIGLFDRVTIGSQIDLIKRLLQQESDAILGIFFALLGCIAILLSANRQEKSSYLSFGGLAILIALYTLSRSDLITLFIRNYLVLDYTHYISFYLMPVSACNFFEGMFGSGYNKIIKRLEQIHLAYAVIALFLLITQWVPWSSTVLPAQILLLSSSLILLTISIKTSRKTSWDYKLFVTGFCSLTFCVIHDVLIYIFEPVQWYHKIYPWGTLIFILCLGFILERRFDEARKRLQAYAVELEKNNAELQKVNQLKDEFLANTSHELKTPLNGIIGIAESLIDGATGKLSQKTIFNLSLIVSSGRRLSQLVNDLLDFSQLKHKKIDLKIQSIGMREITDVVLTLSRPLIGSKNLNLINKIDSNIPLVDADENRLQQILYNLVGNAIKFTESGTVEVSAAVVNKELEITVADTGIGIRADKLDRIFESFEQADGSISREYGGAGLGLTVTKELVQLHGGNIRVESELGKGSQFTFTLLLSQELQVGRLKVEGSEGLELGRLNGESSQELKFQDSEVLTDNPNLQPPNLQPSTPSGSYKILIVDDEPVNLQVLVNHLSLQNYAITQASNGMEALAVMQNGFKPDLILLDVMMPHMTGYEVCQKIREHFPPNELPVVFLTARNQVSDLVEGLDSGANDYLTKPIYKNELLARIKTHIHLSKINIAYSRFVPREFLRFLDKESIVDVQLGDQVHKEMTILFSDIRDFTSLSENMSPKENFNFINSYLSRVGPVIRNHNGFIDKYIGDAIMALFSESAQNALKAAIAMQQQVSLYNTHRHTIGYPSIAIGVGLHTGSLMLGTVGEKERMDTTVIADAVNLASRLEGLTKLYGAGIVISEQTLSRLDEQQAFSCRFLGRVRVKGKKAPVAVFEVYDGDPQPLIELKMQTRADFEQGVYLYHQEQFAQAQAIFQQVLQTNEQDKAARLYIKRCEQLQTYGSSNEWDG